MDGVERLERWIDGSQALEEYSVEIQQLVERLFETESGERLLSVLNGDWMGHPLHPVMTDMAIGGYTVSWFLDIVAELRNDDTLRKSADDALLVGLLSALPTIITGIADWSRTEDRARRLGLVHALTNATGNLLYLTAFLMRKSNRPARFWLAELAALVLTGGAYLGGMLVYHEGVGVEEPQEENSSLEDYAVSQQEPSSSEKMKVPGATVNQPRQSEPNNDDGLDRSMERYYLP